MPAGNMSINASCADIDPVDVVDVAYFIQMIACTDKSGMRQAILRNGKSRSAKSAAATPLKHSFGKTLLGTKGAQGGKGAAARVLTPALARNLGSSLLSFQREPWVFTGLALGSCYWSLGLQYRQTWARTATRRGNLVASVPLGLFPATRELSVRTWETTRTRNTTTDMVESARNTEIGGGEKFSASVKKQLIHETNSTYNPSATINNISIPTQDGATVGLNGSLGISGTFNSLDRSTVDAGSDFIGEATLKAVESLKTARTVSVETSTEGGFDTTSRETLANPNRANTLTYLYYEIVEQIDVTTRAEGVDLYLHIPLPMDHVITPEWLVTNECLVRPLVRCERLAEGFEAARKLLTLNRLAAGRDAAAALEAKNKTPPAVDKDLGTVAKRIEQVVSAYRKLSGASNTGRFIGGWIYWELVKAVSERLADAFDRLEARWGSADFSKTSRTDVVGAIDAFESDVGDLDFEFGKVNAAVNMFLVGGAIAANAVPFGILPYGAVLAVVYACDALGLDLAPDDGGLERRAEEMVNARHALLRQVVEAPPAATGAPATEADPALEAEKLAQRLRAEQEIGERAEAEIAFEALQRYIRERRHFFHRAIWSAYDHGWIAERLRQLGLPPGMFDLRFASFEGEYGAVRLVNSALAKTFDIQLDSLDAVRKSIANLQPRVDQVTVPTSGLIVEPYLGRCQGADEFVSEHRAIDIARAGAERDRLKAEASSAQSEADRLAKRIAAGDLSDPRPFAHVTALTLEGALKGLASIEPEPDDG
jgi:hypothetical protein